MTVATPLPSGRSRSRSREDPYSGAVQPALEDCVLDDVDPAGQVEFTHRIRFVRLDGLDAERQLRRDFLVAVARSDVAKDLRLALGQSGRGHLCPRVFTGKPSGDSRRQRRIEV